MPEVIWKTLQRGKAETIEEREAVTEDNKGTADDMPGYVPTGEDRQIQEVYKDWVYSNNGAHLSGGIQDNKEWQTC